MLRRHLFVYFSATSVYALLSRQLAEAWSVKLSPVLRSAAVPCESRVLWYFNFGSYIVKATFLTIIFLFPISCMRRILAAALHTLTNTGTHAHTQIAAANFIIRLFHVFLNIHVYIIIFFFYT